jgi:16S rRNA (cytosine967-C5)-methyltransferase
MTYHTPQNDAGATSSGDPLTVRGVATAVLDTLDGNRRTLDDVLEAAFSRHPALSRRDRALLTALVFGVQRWRGRLDYIIGAFSRTPLEKIEPRVMNLLRLALFQIIYLDRIPVSAAVNTAVEAAKSFCPAYVVRFVNALLRKAALGYPAIRFPDPNRDPAAALAAAASFPHWIVRRWLRRFGRSETQRLCDAVNAVPPITVRANTLKTDRKELHQLLVGEAASLRPGAYAPDALSLTGLRLPISEMTAFADGRFQVQDEAAQLVTLILDPQAGENVLDACAGLGGKTGHIAQLMRNSGRVCALDKQDGKLRRLLSEMQRLGVHIVETRRADLADEQDLPINETFDRILLDAPCSGMGVMRRNPDIKWRSRESHLTRCSRNQARLLHRLASLVKPGGVLVYAVCSTETEENETVLAQFLKSHPEFVRQNPGAVLPSGPAGLLTDAGDLRTQPHLHDMDGFYCARLRRLA